jgi:hypothetical protein
MHPRQSRCTNHIELCHLTLLTRFMPLNRRTLAFTLAQLMLTACVRLGEWA